MKKRVASSLFEDKENCSSKLCISRCKELTCKNQGFLIAFLFLINFILLLNLVSASTAIIKADGKEYSIELIAVNRESAEVKIGNESKTLRAVQSSPYNPEIFSSAFKELKYVLTERHYATYLGDIKYINLLILIEKNISLSGTAKVVISHDKNSYTFEVPNIVSINQANVRLNSGSNVLATVQNLPYTPEKISPMSDLIYVLTSVDSNYANLLLGFEINMLFECSENWTCLNWSSCVDNQQIRDCTDSNNCGTKKDIPPIMQDCTNEINATNFQPSCTNECETSSKKCFNDTSFKSCSDVNGDNCTEWSNSILCSNNAKCSGNGECFEIPETKNNLILWTILGFGIIGVAGFVLIQFKILKFKKVKRKKRR